MPFAGYRDFADCVSQNKDKDDPDAYCGSIKHRTEDKGFLARAVAKARSSVLDMALNIWDPDDPADQSDNVFTDETKDPDDEVAVVHGLGDIDEGGNAEDTLHKQGRRYISDPSQAPEGVKPQRGKRGGWYYETEGAGEDAVAPTDPVIQFVREAAASGKTENEIARALARAANVSPRQAAVFVRQQLSSETSSPADTDPAKQFVQEAAASGAKENEIVAALARAANVSSRQAAQFVRQQLTQGGAEQVSEAIKAVDGIVRKGKLSDSVSEAIQDLQQASASLEEIGESLGNVGKAVSCKMCKGQLTKRQIRLFQKMMKQRGWTPESHQSFWEKISGAIEKGEPGGHRACVSRMQGKVDDVHAFCAWAEHEGSGRWPGQKD